jgi:NAD(P)-dependent dehydrogenase (short-subunit alcohol dehydrogenase family)
MPAQTIVITGSTDGLGLALAERLAAADTTIVLHGRDAVRGEAAVDAVRRAGGIAELHLADFASLAEVDRFADRVLHDHDRVDLLINNVGIGFGPPGGGRELSADGHELRLAVNYLASVRLTERLLAVVSAAAPSQIVNVASIGQHAIDFDDIELAQGYSGSRAYRQAKLAMIMWTFDLAAELASRRILVNALHPATFMNTRMVLEAGGTPMTTIADGVAAALNVISWARDTGETGAYFNALINALIKEPAHGQAYDTDARRHLADFTRSVLGPRR